MLTRITFLPLVVAFASIAFAQDLDSNQVKEPPKRHYFIDPSPPSTIVVPGSELGVQGGDVVKEINGVPVADMLQATEKLLKEKDSITEIKVLRAGKPLILKKH